MEQIHPIKVYRTERDLSQRAMADFLGVSRLTILRWENWQRPIDPDLVPHVAEKTGIPARELRPDIVEKHLATYGEAAQ
jgi:transcriptional regulator with XRE-family HTH domain